MTRKRKQTIKISNVASLEGLMQEAYNDTCMQINDASKGIAELSQKTIGSDTDIDDLTRISKAKTDYLKIKETAIKMKIELSKLQNDTLKHSSGLDEIVEAAAITLEGNAPSLDAFASIRKMLDNKDKDKK